MILADTTIHTLFHLKVKHMYMYEIPHFRPSYTQKRLIFRTFTPGDLCTATISVAYMEHRLPISDDPVLFITP